MASDPDETFQTGRTQAARQRWLSVAVAIFLHGMIFWGFATAISFRFSEPPDQFSEPRIVALAPRVAPPPPDIDKLGPVEVVTTLPRFRPRLAAMARQRREGDPALAVWKYLCNRDGSLSVAVQRDCPEFHFGDVELGLFDPLNRSGDSGVLLGAHTATMTLEEAAAARGWIKMPPPKGQTGLVNRTDKSHSDPAAERLGPLPWDVGSSKGAAASWSKDRPEVVPDFQ